MANEEETIATLEERISKAVMDCEAWRRTRISESYMEAYDLCLLYTSPSPRD